MEVGRSIFLLLHKHENRLATKKHFIKICTFFACAPKYIMSFNPTKNLFIVVKQMVEAQSLWLPIQDREEKSPPFLP